MEAGVDTVEAYPGNNGENVEDLVAILGVIIIIYY